VEDFDGVLEEFDKIVGIDRLKVLHINDSKNERGASKDRHENLGFGHIGFKALNYIVHHPQLKEVPKILETPYVGEDKKNKKPPYKFEIDMLRSQTFDEDVLTKILNQ
jgi:deoxyribonuclease IV